MTCEWKHSSPWKTGPSSKGRSFGAHTERSGEVVFNTALTGYQEVFTDPSYSGQIVILTNPQIGNYGTSAEDNEARGPFIEGLVVREFSPIASNWRSDSAAIIFAARFPEMTTLMALVWIEPTR